MGRYNCEFIYIVDETRMADIVIKDGIVTSTRYTDVALNLPFGNQPDSSISREAIDLFFAEHCVSEDRANIQEILKYYKLDEFDAYEICRKALGITIDSHCRIKWVYPPLTVNYSDAFEGMEEYFSGRD
jgi:hypothetical protein